MKNASEVKRFIGENLGQRLPQISASMRVRNVLSAVAKTKLRKMEKIATLCFLPPLLLLLMLLLLLLRTVELLNRLLLGEFYGPENITSSSVCLSPPSRQRFVGPSSAFSPSLLVASSQQLVAKQKLQLQQIKNWRFLRRNERMAQFCHPSCGFL